jgi:hypothetical protein
MTSNQEIITTQKRLKNEIPVPHRYSQTDVITQEGRAYFPYPDWWRGQYLSDIPIIVEREAGFRPRILRQYSKTNADVPDVPDVPYPQHCFRPGIKTRYPCYPECTTQYKRYDPTLQRYSNIYLYR